MDKNKLVLPITILIASIILGGFYYASEINKQKSIEKQQQMDLQAKAAADQIEALQDKKEYIVKRKKDCYDLEASERKKFNNTDSSYYNEEKDVCVVLYTTDEYKGVDCATKYKDSFELRLNCLTGTFTKEF